MKASRRRFLQAAALAPALRAPQQPSTVVFRDSSFDPWVEIDAGNLRHNVGEIHRRTNRPILAVIKNNGYGGGVVNIAKVLEPLVPIAGFAVVKLHEAVLLRDAGIRKPLLLMGPFDEHELDFIMSQQIMPMVYTPIRAAIEAAVARAGRRMPIHVCVDTGIGRVGVPFRSAGAFVRDLAAHRAAEIDGIMMTFTEDEAFDVEQLRRFNALTSERAAWRRPRATPAPASSPASASNRPSCPTPNASASVNLIMMPVISGGRSPARAATK